MSNTDEPVQATDPTSTSLEDSFMIDDTTPPPPPRDMNESHSRKKRKTTTTSNNHDDNSSEDPFVSLDNDDDDEDDQIQNTTSISTRILGTTKLKDKKAANKNISPTEKALNFATRYLESLHPSVRPLIEHVHKNFHQGKLELTRLANNKVRMGKDDFIPKTARFKVELTCSTRVKEKADAEYQKLVADLRYQETLFKEEIKTKIVKIIDLELIHAKTAFRHDVCKGLMSIATVITLSIAASQHDILERRPWLPFYIVCFTFEHTPGLLAFLEFKDTDDFFGTLHKLLTAKDEDDDAGPNPYVGLPIYAPCADISKHEYVHGKSFLIDAPRIGVKHFKECVTLLFFESWRLYEQAVNQNKKKLALKKLTDSITKEKATAAVAMDLDEPEKAKQVLDEYVKTTVDKQTKSLQQKINRLANQLHSAKKELRGAADDDSASSKKKSTAQQKKKKKNKEATTTTKKVKSTTGSPPKSGKRSGKVNTTSAKAVATDNASKKGSGKKKNQNGKQQSKPKKSILKKGKSVRFS